MRVRDLKKKSSNRIDTSYLQNLGIQAYGQDNLYPQTLKNIIAASSTASECSDRFADFIEGNGFREVAFSKYVVNRKGDTLDDVHMLLCKDMSELNGIAIHVNYNVFCEIVEMQHVPFENCRLTEEDENGYVAKIAVHPDWSGKKTRKGKALQVKKENIDYIDVFNPKKDVIQAQIEAAGGKKLKRAEERLEDLIIKAPIGGQLSFVKVTPGQQVASGESIAEIKVLDQYKIHTSLSEYYIDRITTGLPATVNYQGKRYPLRITKVVPEVKDRMFDVDLVFTDDMPDNVRVGKSFRVQIELGQPEQTLIIPRGNFYQATGGQWIYKVNASKTKAVRVPLSVGRQNPQQYEITEGLQPGDWVITTGYDTFGEAEELIMK